jgi:hypothetical protein
MEGPMIVRDKSDIDVWRSKYLLFFLLGNPNKSCLKAGEIQDSACNRVHDDLSFVGPAK